MNSFPDSRPVHWWWDTPAPEGAVNEAGDLRYQEALESAGKSVLTWKVQAHGALSLVCLTSHTGRRTRSRR